MISVSQATRLIGSFVSAASRTASEIWSAILSGCPSVTDSEVKRKVRSAISTERTLAESTYRCGTPHVKCAGLSGLTGLALPWSPANTIAVSS